VVKAVARKSDRRFITTGRFRRKRFYLADHVFLDPGVRSNKANDPLSKKQWDRLMALPTDVLLRTTDHMGTMIWDMQRQWSAWMDALPIDPKDQPFCHLSYLDVLDELAAAPFVAVHGYYRQAASDLRNSLEVMAHSCRYAIRDDEPSFRDWQEDVSKQPKFGNSIDIIGEAPAGRALDARLGGQGLFGSKPDGVMRALYANLCRYAHSQPKFSNGAIWQSNGPVFVPRAFTQLWLDFCDTSLACFALLKLAYQPAIGSGIFELIAGNAGVSWHGLAPATVKALGLSPLNDPRPR